MNQHPAEVAAAYLLIAILILNALLCYMSRGY